MLKSISIREIPESERPYERFYSMGVSALSNSELLAIILRTGAKDKNVITMAREILNLCDKGNNLSKIINISENEFCLIKGIGKVKAAQLVCIGELARRISISSAEEQLDFSTAKTVANYYMETMRYFQQEKFILTMLNIKNKLIKDKCLFAGNINMTVVSPREIFQEALKNNAAKILVLHNHPSGDPTPSNLDVEITSRLFKLGNMLGIELVDHIVIGNKKYYSFKENGII